MIILLTLIVKAEITEAVSVGAFKCSLKTYLITLHDEELRKLCD